MKLETVLQDLRFIIGALFLIYGAVLIFLGLTEPVAAGRLNLNLLAGGLMAVFSVTMLGFAFVHAREEEVVERKDVETPLA